MLHQKQGARVKISSHEKVINMSEVYIPRESICSCEQCESISCLNIRNTNSGIPCTCMDCDANKCFTWESNKQEYKPDNETRTVFQEISKDMLNVPETTIKCEIIPVDTCDNVKSKERLINTTNRTKKEKISFSYFDNPLQNHTSDDHEFKEVFTKEEKLIGTLKNLLENKNIHDFELKDSSSNEISDIIECNAKDLLKKRYGDPKIMQAFGKYESKTEICCQKNKTLEIKYDRDHETQNNEMKTKQLSSKINTPIPKNEPVYSDTTELLTRKIRNSCKQKITTDNTKSDFQELYQIFTNGKKNIVKHADASEKKQDNLQRNKKKCAESKEVNNETGATEYNSDTNTSMKITNTKCYHDHPIKEKISLNRISFNKRNKAHEKCVPRLQSAASSSALPDFENSRAELSAQIMNVPYADLKDSLSRKQSSTYSTTCNSSSKIEKYDILSVLRRLKEIYKACSCKVCECIAVQSLFNPSEVCKCEPCDCDDCNSYMAKLQKRIIHAPAPDSGCPCVNCDRKDCRGIVKKGNYTDCDCKPSDYVICSECFTKQCSCTPCQCEKCKTSIFMPQNLMIANATESFQQSNCDCEPCVCTDCTSNQSINPLFNRSDICNCEPCDCDECNGYMVKLQKRIIHAPAPDSGCPCVNCDRKDCRGIVKKKSNYKGCDCKSSDYVRCSKSLTKKYSSSPGQCAKCKTSTFVPQNLMIANAVESFQQSNCDCEPCECTNCTSRYSAMTSNLMREVSTGMIVYGNCSCEDCSNNTCQLGRSSCRCDSQHRVIRKPMTEKKADYGIHRVNIKKNIYEKKAITINNQNTITMFALSNKYHNNLFNYSNKKNSCECDVCECIVCKDRGKESVMNDSHNIEKQICNLNTNALKYYESCEILHPENVAGKCCVETGYDANNTTTNSKYVGYNYEIMNNNENLKKAQPKYLTFEKKCSSRCKNLVNVPSQNSSDTNDSFIHDSDKCSLLKRGTLLTPSKFENKELTQNSSQIHVKPENDNLRENDLRKKKISNLQDTKLYRNKSQHNYFGNDYNENIINETPKSDAKIKSRHSSIFNMLSKEVGTKEIYKINSVEFKKGNVSKVFFEHSKSNAQNNDSKAKLLDEDLIHKTSKPSTHCNKKLGYNKTINKVSQTSWLDRLEAEDFFYKTMSSSDNDIHLSSAESMSLVTLLCEERNLDIHTTNTRKFLQSLEKIPLKRLKIVQENFSYTSDKYLNDDIILDSFGRSNYSFSTKNNLLINMEQDQSDTLNWENNNLKTNLTDKKINKYNIYGKNTLRVPVPKIINQITPKEKTDFQMVERKPNNYNIIAKGGVAQPIINKPYSEAKIANTNPKSKAANHSKDNVNKSTDKRYLEKSAARNTAASARNFTEYDKCIDFERSFKLLKEVNAGYDKNKKESPILMKNLFINQGVGKNKDMCSIPLLVLDTKIAIKSTNTTSPFCSRVGFGDKALEQTKLQTEVNELPHSPLLLSQTNSHREKSWSKSKCNLGLNCRLSNATSQTLRNNTAVDKEVNCNMIESKENLKQSIQNLINMTLTDVVQRNMILKREIQILNRTDIETRNQNVIRDSNEASGLNAARSSCGGLRTSFVGLRKVSDHSVLLKWDMPRDLRNIRGYEVDGHPVKKILNPSRCMAVLTCLPHSEKLLLTIRTITKLDTSHNPVTTIIYNPKKNKSTL